MRLNTKGQLTTGEWCNDKDNSGQALTVQWCQMGTVNGPWQYDPQQKMMLHTGINKCLGLEPESGRPILRACDNHRTGMILLYNHIIGLKVEILTLIISFPDAYYKWEFRQIKPYWAKTK